jgi:hypothetical protein
MRLRAGFASSQLTLFPLSGTTSWTVDSEHLFCGEFFFHAGETMPQIHGQEWSILNSFWQAPM